MALFPFYSAKFSKVRMNGVVFVCSLWNVDDTPEEIDTSNFESAGFSDAINGLVTARVRLEFVVDGANNPWDLNFCVPTLIQGAVASYPTNLKLFLNDTTGPFWLFPTYMIAQCTTPADVKANGKGTVNIRNKGTYTRPTGVIAA